MGTREDGHKYGQPHSPITIPTLAPLAFRPWGSPTTKLDIQLDILPRKRIGWPGAAVWADCVRVLDPATLPGAPRLKLNADLFKQRVVCYLESGD